MSVSKPKTGSFLWQSLALIAACLIGLSALGHFDPVPERAPQTGGVFLYYGQAGETLIPPGLAPDTEQAAKAALQDADYFGAFAVGPGGRTGVWLGARTPDLARSYALAQCGTGCTIAAERVPLHRDPNRSEPILTHAMAVNLAVKWPFTQDVLAIGGANAWGHATKSAGSGGWNRAKRKAAADCEARRAAERLPEGLPKDLAAAPCLVLTLAEIEDLRPETPLYPAPYTISLTEIAPIAETRMVNRPDAPPSGIFGPYLPPRLYGARAAASETWDEVVREAGWPEAGEAIALVKCNAGRRPDEPPCRVSHIRMPDADPAPGVLLVTPQMHAAYVAWQATGGAGAFAISPYGAWGFSYDWDSTDTALQKAADWCWYHTRKNWEYRQVERAFLDPGLACRIVALREG